MSLVQLLTF
jgi:hypothetical protein